jgi:hypothetical protein
VSWPYFFFNAATAAMDPECSPPRRTGIFPALMTARTLRSISFKAAAGPVVVTGISVDTKIPDRYGSILFSSSKSSM